MERDEDVGNWLPPREGRLYRALRIAPDRTLTRTDLVADLWPDLAPPSAAANLRQAAHHLGRYLQARPGVRLVADRRRLSLVDITEELPGLEWATAWVADPRSVGPIPTALTLNFAGCLARAEATEEGSALLASVLREMAADAAHAAGDDAEAAILFDAVATEHQREGRFAAAARVAFKAARTLIDMGRLEAGRAGAARVYADAVRTVPSAVAELMRINLVFAHAASGDVSAAEAAFRRVHDVGGTLGAANLSTLHLARGEARRAAEILHRAFSEATHAADRSLLLHRSADALSAAGDPTAILAHATATRISRRAGEKTSVLNARRSSDAALRVGANLDGAGRTEILRTAASASDAVILDQVGERLRRMAS